MLRMAMAPGQKHVPLQFPAWVCMQEDCITDNMFAASQLLTDRCCAQTYMSHVERLVTKCSSVFSADNKHVLIVAASYQQVLCTNIHVSYLKIYQEVCVMF